MASSRRYGLASTMLYAPAGHAAAIRQASARFSTAVRLNGTSGPGSNTRPRRTDARMRGSRWGSPGP